jgi:broad specificity phosphatase PhoE
MKLYFVRHGHTDAKPNTDPNPETGEVDEPLNVEGIQQANNLAEQLKEGSFDAIIASPLKRAHQTADIVNKYHELPVEIDAVWRERDIGAYVTIETWNDLFDFDKNFSLETSEGLRTFFKRVYDGLDTLKEKYEDKTILLVSHSGVHQAIYAYANKLPLTGNGRVSPLHNCEYRIYDL